MRPHPITDSFSPGTVFALAAALGAVGCMAADEEGGAEPGDVESWQGAIQGGQLETGYPGIGMITMDAGSCTGSLIAPTFVLTSAHCAGTNMVFKIGTSSANFSTYNVDQQILHPSVDLMIVHLTTPVLGVPVVRINTGNLPGAGTVCTAVGFGKHTENGQTTSGVKRSATVSITSADNTWTAAQQQSGMTDEGDSGGPLLCSDRIDGVAKSIGLWVTPPVAWIHRTISPVYTELALLNGWTTAPYGTKNAGAGLVSHLVQLKGAIASGTTGHLFTLPSGLRPATSVYVPVDLCNAANGRLIVDSSGAVTVQAEGAFGDAQCFTSLEGVSFAKDTTGFTQLSLVNGWTHAANGTSNAAVSKVGGIVRLKGAMAWGTTNIAFTLPTGFRPSTGIVVPVDMCGSKRGKLVISTGGTVSVFSAGPFTDAQCHTSLDGVTFAEKTTGFTTLTLQNGWTNGHISRPAAAQILSGVVRFMGELKTTGTNQVPFTLPSAFRPTTNVYVPVLMCAGTKGRLTIEPSGAVTVAAFGGVWANAQCSTSLDGVSYTLSDYTPITLANGWGLPAAGTARPEFAIFSGVVHLRGAMSSTGTSGEAFTLPAEAWSLGSEVFVPVTLTSSKKGRLYIRPNGVVTATAEVSFNDAKAFTSLEAVSYPPSTTGFTTLALQNGWATHPTTRAATVTNTSGIIRLAGGIRNGTNATVFTLPAAFRPAHTVYAPIDLCAGTKGRLIIQSNGNTSVEAAGGVFGNAQCFTSLESVSFGKTTAGFTALALQNGWTATIYGTATPGVMRNSYGVVRFQGAIASGTTAVAFTLPAEYRPKSTVYMPIDLCGAAKGRLHIPTSGVATVQIESGSLATAQCFTSLEGAWFVQ